MKQKSMTALVSAFARAYHSEQNGIKIFNDDIAKLLLSDQEYNQIYNSMAQGIRFFNPDFNGNEKEALQWIVDHQLAPSPLGRSAFAEKALKHAVRFGTMQYLILAAGYDSFAYRQPEWASKLQLFEIDHPVMSKDKQERIHQIYGTPPENLTYVPFDLQETHIGDTLLSQTHYDRSSFSFWSLLGITYYLSKEHFENLIKGISNTVCVGSTIVFDYPDQDTYTEKAGPRAKKQTQMAGGAGETMLASYSYSEMETLLSHHDFLIYEHLEPHEITEQYFSEYNKANPQNTITAFDNVNYCLAVKR